MFKFNHNNLARVNHAFIDDENIVFDLEFLPNGSLHSMIDKYKHVKGLFGLGKELSKVYLAQMLNGLEHMQSLDVVHRDLKPLNVMLDENYNAKLIDFGDAKCLSEVESEEESSSSETSEIETDPELEFAANEEPEEKKESNPN